MTVEHWDRVQELFEAALDHPASERDRWLRQACEDDVALHADVASLLASDAQADALIDTPVAALFDATATGEPPDFAPGSAIDQYEIEARIGEGAFGSVYRARHVVIGKRAAIKVLHPEHAASSMLARRFINEARAVNAIGHPNIIDIFGFGETPDGRLYFTMEYVDAPTLEEVLVREGRLSLAQALPILLGLAAALDAAHDRGIVHRDLKPANVLVSRDAAGAWVPKLLDFGIATLVHREDEPVVRTQAGQMMGTPAYMAPEQIRGLPVDGRTDAYALGVLAYRMLTGELPFSARTTFDMLAKHTQEDPRPPSELAPESSATVDAFVLGLLAKDAVDRPARLAPAVRKLGEASVVAESAGTARSLWTIIAVLIGVAALVAWASARSSAPEASTTAPAVALDPGSEPAPQDAPQSTTATPPVVAAPAPSDPPPQPESEHRKPVAKKRRPLNEDLESPFGR